MSGILDLCAADVLLVIPGDVSRVHKQYRYAPRHLSDNGTLVIVSRSRRSAASVPLVFHIYFTHRCRSLFRPIAQSIHVFAKMCFYYNYYDYIHNN
jgi:hypothetical protein